MRPEENHVGLWNIYIHSYFLLKNFLTVVLCFFYFYKSYKKTTSKNNICSQKNLNRHNLKFLMVSSPTSWRRQNTLTNWLQVLIDLLMLRALMLPRLSLEEVSQQGETRSISWKKSKLRLGRAGTPPPYPAPERVFLHPFHWTPIIVFIYASKICPFCGQVSLSTQFFFLKKI
jgi:hypothetical protein